MLQVDLQNILTEEDALQKIQDIFTHVENEKETYVVTKDGKPVLAIVDVATLERIPDDALTPAPVAASVAPPISEPAMPEFGLPPLDVPEPPVDTPPIIPTLPPAEPAAEISADPAPTGFSPLPPLETPVAEAPVAPAAPVTPVAPQNNEDDLPDMPEDPTNSSPLA